MTIYIDKDLKIAEAFRQANIMLAYANGHNITWSGMHMGILLSGTCNINDKGAGLAWNWMILEYAIEEK